MSSRKEIPQAYFEIKEAGGDANKISQRTRLGITRMTNKLHQGLC